MIFSAEQLFSDDQAITATADSTNVLDLGVAGTPHGGAAALNRDVGKGNSIPILIQVTEAFDNLTSLAIAIETGSTTALNTEIVTQTLLLADLVVGQLGNIIVVPIGVTERYLGLSYTVVGTAPTVGKITAGICMGVQTNTTGA